MDLNLAFDANWAFGLMLALARMAGFVIASPILSSAVPMPGRIATAFALAFFFAEPLAAEPTVPALAALVVVNSVVGIVLGYLTGMLFHLFVTAGNLIDVTSGLSAAALFDPLRAETSAPFGRLFNIAALAIFAAIGGLQLLVRGLALSLRAIPLDGSINPDGGLVTLTLRLFGQMIVAAAQLALPVLAALFLAEVVLGLAARFAPQANIFLLGLPAKLLVTFSVSGVVLLFFPEAMDHVLSVVEETFTNGLRGLAA